MTRRDPTKLGLFALGLTAAALGAAGPARAQEASHVLLRTRDEGPRGRLAVDRGAIGLWQRMQKLRTTGSVLYTTGHPDDEEAGVLTLLSRGMGVRTSLLTLNRGEGGANALGSELFDALGLVRSEELRLAGRYYGLDDQYFTTAIDYGYSKTLAEAMRSWDREALLGDMVRIIRTNRPLVVVSRWHGSERDGHGHHQAAGVLTPEAVLAAADPGRFPEQITREGLRPWGVPKLYRGRVQETETVDVELDPYTDSPWLGSSYQEFGAYGLSLQRSQTQGRLRGGGSGPPARYERLPAAARAREVGLFDGLDVSLAGIFDLVDEPGTDEARAALQRAQERIGQAFAIFSLTDPGAVAPHLANARSALVAAAEATPPESEAAFLIAVETRELDLALEAALGVGLEATAVPAGAPAGEPMGPAVPGQELDVHATLAVAGPHPVELRDLRVVTREGWPTRGVVEAGRVEAGSSVAATLGLTVPAAATPSRPWFVRTSISENVYAVRDSAEIHLGESRPRARVEAVVVYAGHELEVTAPVRTLESQAPFGSARRPLTVAPALSVRVSPTAAVLAPGAEAVSVIVEVTANAPGPVDAVVALELPEGWTSSPEARSVSFEGAGQSERVDFSVEPGQEGRRRATVRAHATAGGRRYGEGYQRIVHPDLQPTYLYADAAMEVVPVDIAVPPDMVVGYVMGVGDEVPAAIEQLGAAVRLLTEADLSGGDLSALDAIVVGTRAYAVRQDLVAHNRRLLDYAAGGGNLVVLYQTPEYRPETQAPFPASLPGNAEEVSEEDAPVRILAPDHPLLTTPNRLGPEDFDGWVEQRGSKHFAAWDSAYTPLIETHDTGQAPQEGVWLAADVGEGHFTYASIALHRQLPYGVPGAYRILANLLSR